MTITNGTYSNVANQNAGFAFKSTSWVILNPVIVTDKLLQHKNGTPIRGFLTNMSPHVKKTNCDNFSHLFEVTKQLLKHQLLYLTS